MLVGFWLMTNFSITERNPWPEHGLAPLSLELHNVHGSFLSDELHIMHLLHLRIRRETGLALGCLLYLRTS